MTDKFEALSQPVAYRNRYTDVFYPAEDNSMRTVAMGTAPTIYSPAYSQEYVTALLAALEEKDQRIKELEGDVRFERLRLNEAEIAALIQRADAAEQREKTYGLQACELSDELARLQRRNAELERANAAQDDHINQQQDRIDTLEKRNGELGKYTGQLEQRLQQPIKLPKREIGMACEFVSDHIVVSLEAVLAEAATAGFKAEVEGE